MIVSRFYQPICYDAVSIVFRRPSVAQQRLTAGERNGSVRDRVGDGGAVSQLCFHVLNVSLRSYAKDCTAGTCDNGIR